MNILTRTYPTPTELVTEFHQTYGLPIRTEPQLDVPERAMRVALVVEEAREYADAEAADDFIEVADALGDLVYVAVGAALAHGFAISSYRVSRDYGSFEAPAPTLEIPARRLWVQRVKHHVSEYVRAEQLGDFALVKLALAAIVDTCYGAAKAHGINLDEVLQEIQRSNLSKLGEDGKPIYREDGKVLKGPNFFTPDIESVLERQRKRSRENTGESA